MSNLSSLKAARVQAQENIDNLNNNINMYNNNIKSLESEKLKLDPDGSLTAIKEETNDLRYNNEQLRNGIDGLKEQNSSLEAEKENLFNSNEALHAENTRLESIRDATQDIAEKERINAQITENEKTIADNVSAINQNNNEIASNESTIQQNEGLIADNNKKIKLNKINENISSEKEKLNAQENAKKNLRYTEEDLENLDELMEEIKLHEQNPVSKYNISSITGSDAGVHPDIRNLPGAMNFRSYASKYADSLKKLGESEYSAVAEKTSLARSFYMNQDFLFTNSLASPIPLGKVAHDTMPEIQPLIINEFQPYEMLQFKDVFDGLAGIIDKIFGLSNNSDGGVLSPFISLGKVYFANRAIDNAYKNTSDLYIHGSRGPREYFTSDPVRVVENMFGGGKWLNTYEIPFYGSDYLIAKYSDKWTVGNGEEAIGKTFSTLFGADFPANPKFKTTMAESRRPTIETKFYLINANSEWMRRNFEFIQAIFAGTSWVHLKYCRLRPPNIYNVVCPGRFHMIYATMDITVTFEGKLRKNPKFSNSLRSMGIKSVDEDTLWPDAWKIELSIHDLTPNNFNMYANYYMNGFDIDEMATLANKNDMITALSKIPGYITNYWSEILDSEAAEKVKNWVNENITPKINALKDKAANMFNNPDSPQDGNGQSPELNLTPAQEASLQQDSNNTQNKNVQPPPGSWDTLTPAKAPIYQSGSNNVENN